MKNALRILLPILCLLFLVLIVVTTVQCVSAYHELAQTPGTSGSDFLMFGVGYGINCLAYSLLGLISALFFRRLIKKRNKSGAEAGFALFLICLFSLTLVMSIGLFYL